MEILLTGANGFLGSHIAEYCKKFPNLHISTLGRSATNDICCDLAKGEPVLDKKFDLIIHAAGKAHEVPINKSQKIEFFNVNIKGTINLLNGITRAGLPKNFVFISSVAVYGLIEGTDISEIAALNATDPYGISKIEAEVIIKEWCKKNSIICTILRLPLIAGSNSKGNLATMISGIKKGYYFNIAQGKSKKSVVLAEDVAAIILQPNLDEGIYNLTDGMHPSFRDLSYKIASILHKDPPMNIPYFLAVIISKIGDIFGSKAPLNTIKLNKIISTLTFNDSQAVKRLNWKPRSVLDNFTI